MVAWLHCCIVAFDMHVAFSPGYTHILTMALPVLSFADFQKKYSFGKNLYYLILKKRKRP
jgi:hypothetical protein